MPGCATSLMHPQRWQASASTSTRGRRLAFAAAQVICSNCSLLHSSLEACRTACSVFEAHPSLTPECRAPQCFSTRRCVATHLSCSTVLKVLGVGVIVRCSAHTSPICSATCPYHFPQSQCRTQIKKRFSLRWDSTFPDVVRVMRLGCACVLARITL